MNKKDKSQNRNLYIKIRVNQAEMDLIKRKFRESGMQTFSGFIRTMILEGYIVKIDESKFQEIHKLATSVARNVNQITIRFHNTGRLYENDITEIKDGLNKLWQSLIFLQTKILQLKHWPISIQIKMLSGIIQAALKVEQILEWYPQVLSLKLSSRRKR